MANCRRSFRLFEIASDQTQKRLLWWAFDRTMKWPSFSVNDAQQQSRMLLPKAKPPSRPAAFVSSFNRNGGRLRRAGIASETALLRSGLRRRHRAAERQR